ncbi:MAG: hypothetical protein L6Q54_10935 [Leptospiraceae bacterium]|nr:hypothetical protein [Leptospiraceae bacterium]MCK6381743.1 hypothetical protein [Leptospiraceae bacterium]NUM42814.1 hypothetical protein [Leptospiraceae bacterium]
MNKIIFITFLLNCILNSRIFSQENEITLPFPDLVNEVKKEESQKNEILSDDFQNELKKIEANEKAKINQAKNNDTNKEPSPQKSEEKKSANLPNTQEKSNLKKLKKKSSKGSENSIDESEPSYERGTIQLQRGKIENSKLEFKDSVSKEKEFSFKSKLEEIRILALEKKIEEAKNLAQNLENPDEKFQALFELARSLDNNSETSKEDSVSIYMTIITESPKTEKIRQRSLWSISHLLYRVSDFQTSLYFLSDIIKNHKDSEYYKNALYLCGKIYEKPWNGKDIEKSKRFFSAYINTKLKDNFLNSDYSKEANEKIQDTF